MLPNICWSIYIWHALLISRHFLRFLGKPSLRSIACAFSSALWFEHTILKKVSLFSCKHQNGGERTVQSRNRERSVPFEFLSLTLFEDSASSHSQYHQYRCFVLHFSKNNWHCSCVRQMLDKDTSFVISSKCWPHLASCSSY